MLLSFQGSDPLPKAARGRRIHAWVRPLGLSGIGEQQESDEVSDEGAAVDRAWAEASQGCTF